MVIFVVDDEHIITNTLAIILRQQGFEVFPFCSGRAALEQAATCAPDLLVTDVAMPEVDGLELASTLVALHPMCDVICFSGHAQRRDLVSHPLYQSKWNCISKPMHPQVLVQEIHTRWNARQQSDINCGMVFRSLDERGSASVTVPR